MFIVALIEYPPSITAELLSSRRIGDKRSQKLGGRHCLTRADAESAVVGRAFSDGRRYSGLKYLIRRSGLRPLFYRVFGFLLGRSDSDVKGRS